MENLPRKVVEYERFLNETLREDLRDPKQKSRKILEERDKIYDQIADYLQLKTVIERIKDAGITEDLKTKVDLGCNFYVQANVPDATKIFVFVGYGFFVEFTLDEALKFIDKRSTFLTGHTDRLTKDVAKVKANIKLVLEALREIQNIDNTPEPEPVRELWD